MINQMSTCDLLGCLRQQLAGNLPAFVMGIGDANAQNVRDASVRFQLQVFQIYSQLRGGLLPQLQQRLRETCLGCLLSSKIRVERMSYFHFTGCLVNMTAGVKACTTLSPVLKLKSYSEIRAVHNMRY